MPAKKTKASHDRIRIQMMNEFVIYINERRAEHMANKSKKGLALIGVSDCQSKRIGHEPAADVYVLGG